MVWFLIFIDGVVPAGARRYYPRVLGFLAAVMALTPATTGLPVVLLAPTEPAPTNVTLGWVSPARAEGFIAWDETGDVRNKIILLNEDGTPAAIGEKFVEAGQPNRTSMFGGLLDANFRVRVTVVDADGAELSEPADSPLFDTDRDPAAEITSVVPREDGTILLTWKPGEHTDPNPGDLFDVPVVPFRYIPVASQLTFPEYDHLSEPTTATSFVIPARPTPANVGVRTAPNGWYGYTGVSTPVEGNRLTTRIPASATVGGRLTVTGKAVRLDRVCDLAACEAFEWDDAGRELRLQTRAGAAAGWRTVATTKANKDGGFVLRAGFTGAADYRVVAPALARAPGRSAQAFAASDVRSVAAGPVADPGDGQGGGQGGGLPITGTPVMWIAVAGGLLVALGVVLAVAGRARRKAQ